MNWKLVLSLSLLSVPMACVAVFTPINAIEPFLWLVLFVLYAILIAKKTEGKHFLHGMTISVLNSVWISIIHSIFFDTYIVTNPEQMMLYNALPPVLPTPVMMLIVGPIFGLMFGIVAGLFAFIAGKIIKRS